MRRERGSALISVILVVLVLTLVGLAALLYMNVEDRISSNDQLLKEALYAAEVGLRNGEHFLGSWTDVPGFTITRLLTHTSAASTPAVSPGVPVQPPAYDLSHLGTYLTDPATGTETANQAVTYKNTAGQSVSNRAFFSLYVRNNSDDYSGSATGDQDGVVHMISVGYVLDSANRVSAVKVLAEGFKLGANVSAGSQKGNNMGGTNAM